MKNLVLFVAAGVATVSFGWGLGDALKVVDQATTTANEVNDSLKNGVKQTQDILSGKVPTETAEKTKTAETVEQTKKVDTTPAAEATPQPNVPSGSARTTPPNDPMQEVLARERKNQEDTAKFNQSVKELDEVYGECRVLINHIYSTYDQSSQRDSELRALRTYFNEWESGVGPTGQNRELISMEKANERLEQLKALKAEREAAKTAAEEARQKASMMGTIINDCENAIDRSKLTYEAKGQRKRAMYAHFSGKANDNATEIRYLHGDAATITIDEANAYKAQLDKELADIAALPSSTDEAALRKAVESKELEYQFNGEVTRQLAAITQDGNLLMALYTDGTNNGFPYGVKEVILSGLSAHANAITDKEVVLELLRSDGVTDAANRAKLLARLPESEALEFVQEKLKYYGVHSWNENKLVPFDDAVALMNSAKDSATAVALASLVLKKFDEYENDCNSSLALRWDDGDKAKIANLIARFPKFDNATLEALICADKTGWRYLIDTVSADVAYDVIAAGKSQSGELESALAKKLPKERIDLKVYNGAKFDATKKVLDENLPPELKAAAEAAGKAAYETICKKAESAAKATFELDGFYLGMDIDDAKVVLGHHFPTLKIREAVDGSGSDADCVIYVDGQKSPFCYARTSDRKVWQFNFGSKLLAKWYDFDVQTYAEWAAAYQAKTGAAMRLKPVEKDTTVYEDDMSSSYEVQFRQEAYQHRNSKKCYRLTYFGEASMETTEDGLGGDLIKERAAPDFRYVRGDSGSLRVNAIKDE